MQIRLSRSKRSENGSLVVATPFVVYNRAMMLGSANLEIAYTSTQENCVKVQASRTHKGHVDNGPHFVLEDKKGFKPQVTVTDKEAVLVTGDTKLVVSLGKLAELHILL